jgi:hypothetical protein
MAASCKQREEKIEESVLQPMDTWVNQLQQTCADQPCNWWVLCLNKVICWLVWVVVKVTVFVVTIVVRYVYRIVCTLVMLVVGVLALFIGNTAVLGQAFKDLWGLVKDVSYSIVGLIIFVALRIVDIVQTIFGVQRGKRHLTEKERALLRPIFRDSLDYDAIEIVDGNAGLLTMSGRAFTMGFTIYLPTPGNETLVHECVHVWQFEFGGFGYIGNSALNQLDATVFNPGYDPYSWTSGIDAGATWYTLGSVEAQAKFVENVFTSGEFVFNDPLMPPNTAPGAFFHDDPKVGMNLFQFNGKNYTQAADDAWQILRTA